MSKQTMITEKQLNQRMKEIWDKVKLTIRSRFSSPTPVKRIIRDSRNSQTYTNRVCEGCVSNKFSTVTMKNSSTPSSRCLRAKSEEIAINEKFTQASEVMSNRFDLKATIETISSASACKFSRSLVITER